MSLACVLFFECKNGRYVCSRTKIRLRAPNKACLPFKPWLLNESLDRNGFSSDINKWNEFYLADT